MTIFRGFAIKDLLAMHSARVISSVRYRLSFLNFTNCSQCRSYTYCAVPAVAGLLPFSGVVSPRCRILIRNGLIFRLSYFYHLLVIFALPQLIWPTGFINGLSDNGTRPSMHGRLGTDHSGEIENHCPQGASFAESPVRLKTVGSGQLLSRTYEANVLVPLATPWRSVSDLNPETADSTPLAAIINQFRIHDKDHGSASLMAKNTTNYS
ncbi:hypothetical protein C8J57DRAFT_1477944 [Mycena rebaudengoi]|nr:hypothetical protein C8J57DRAFT_1477944 [Mycena rebaudengoi]